MFVLVLGLCWILGSAAQVAVFNLKVEKEVAPVGVGVVPRFSWNFNYTERGAIQISYQILISKSQPGDSDVWNSGVVLSKRPYLIEYAGPALLSDTRYFWIVNVTTTVGSGSASSEFTTGFLSATNWNPSVIGKRDNGPTIPNALVSSFRSASWIWTSETEAPNAPPGDRAFRKTYTPPSGNALISATILMTADDQFVLYVNGDLIGSSPTTQNVWETSQVFNVSLQPGANLFAVRATNLADVNTGGDSPAGLLASIVVTFSDGTTSTITSGSSWLSIKTIPNNFQSPSLDDSSWVPATVIAVYNDGPWGSEVALPSPDISSSPTSSLVPLPPTTIPNSGNASSTALLPTMTTSVTDKNVVPDIIGGIVGGFFLLIIIALASLFLCRLRRRLRLQETNVTVEPLPFLPQNAPARDKNGRYKEDRPRQPSVLAVSTSLVASEVFERKAVIQDQHVSELQTDQASSDSNSQASITPGTLEARLRQQMEVMGDRIMELESQQKELGQLVGGNVLNQQRPPDYFPTSDPRTIV